jgi:hypothetical protein
MTVIALVHNQRIPMVLYQDLRVWHEVREQRGFAFHVGAFTDAGVVHAPYWSPRHRFAHELSHAYEYRTTGRVDTRLNPSCLQDEPETEFPLDYWCQNTEILARYRERKWDGACRGSLYPFGFNGEPCAFAMADHSLRAAIAERAW